MGSFRTIIVSGSALLLAACGTTRDRQTAVDDNLNKDLELASSAGVQLAPQGGALQVVSAVERVPQSAAASSRAPRPSPKRHQKEPTPKPAPVTSPEPKREASDVAQNATVADAPAPEPSEAPAPGPDAGVAPIPQPTRGPVVIGSGDTGRGGVGIGGILGGLGGVILRGGGIGDDDHCEIEPGMPRMPRGRGGRHGGTIIDRRLPTGGGIPTRSGGGSAGGIGGTGVWAPGRGH